MTRAACFAITILLVLGCSAALAQLPVTLGFISSDGSSQYCDYETLEIAPPFATGIHVLTSCGLPADGTLIGLRGSILPSAKLPVTGGQTYLLADSTADALDGTFTGVQFMLVTATTPVNPRKPKFGWEFVYNTYESFSQYLGDWGYLTANVPGERPINNESGTSSMVSSVHRLVQNHVITNK